MSMAEAARSFANTRSSRAEIRRLAGTVPADEICRRLGVSYGRLRNLASEMGVSIRFGAESDFVRPGADDRAVARLDAARSRTFELRGVTLSAEVASVLRQEATTRATSLEALVARLVSMVALDGIVAAVLDER